MLQRIATHVSAALDRGDSSERLAFTIALSTYVAFCPFLGLHTVLVVLFSWLFCLSMPCMLLVSNLINNPWTMVPVYGSGYACGQWILGSFLGQDTLCHNPFWMDYFNAMLTSVLGISHVSLCSFLVGGNVLGICVGLLMYPLAKIGIARMRISRRNPVDCGIL